jgi:hypothetical protein
MVIVKSGDKYALVVMPEAVVDEGLPRLVEVADGLWFCRESPFDLSAHWTEWIGTVRAAKMKEANLILLSKGPSKNPDILDAENEFHKKRVLGFYEGLILSGFIYCYASPFSIMGAVRGNDLDVVRSIGEISQPHVIPWMEQEKIDLARLQRAAQYSAVLPDFEGTDRFARIGRIIRAFNYGILAHNPWESLHQFVRCIEGFIYPAKGHSTSQFKSRTELFLGHGFHGLAGELYDIRSAVEHLHDPSSVISAGTERERRVRLIVRSVEAEALARWCIQRLLENPSLRTHFETDFAIKNFWKMPEDDKCRIWGATVDITAITKRMEIDRITDEEIGLGKR